MDNEERSKIVDDQRHTQPDRECDYPSALPAGVSMSEIRDWEDAGDIDLMEGLANQEEPALRSLIRRFSPIVIAVCLQILNNRADAEDVSAELFVELWERSSRFDAARGKPRSYILLLARSRSLDRLRKLAGRRDTLLDNTIVYEMVNQAESAPEKPMELKELAAAVRDGLEELTEPQRESVSLAFFEGLTHREIAGQLDMPLGTVKTHIRNGLSKLRYALKSSSEGED